MWPNWGFDYSTEVRPLKLDSNFIAKQFSNFKRHEQRRRRQKQPNNNMQMCLPTHFDFRSASCKGTESWDI